MAEQGNRERSNDLSTVMVAVVVLAIVIITILTITAIWLGPPTI